MDPMQRSKTCEMHEYCTNCPARIGCGVRLGFYDSDEKYSEAVKTANLLTLQLALAAGIDFCSCATEINNLGNLMDKKRRREKELHPFYSFY